MAAAKLQAFFDKNGEFTSDFVAPPDISAMTTMPRGNVVAIVTCMDPRSIPEHFFKLAPLEAPVIRVAGGRAKPALESLLVLENAFGLAAIIVIHHTDCGMTHMTDASLKQAFKEKRPEKAAEVESFKFNEITGGDLQASVKSDVEFLKGQSYFSEGLKVTGAIYNTFTGKVDTVV